MDGDRILRAIGEFFDMGLGVVIGLNALGVLGILIYLLIQLWIGCWPLAAAIILLASVLATVAWFKSKR
jgi:amino acid transporter